MSSEATDTLQSSGLSRDLPVFLRGLLPVLSFASLTVRPLLYGIFDTHISKLDRKSLRPALKSIILSLLPGIEDETSEDFEKGIAVLDGFRRIHATEDIDASSSTGLSSWESHFWQCFFSAVITNESRRQGALAYLNRRLPSLATSNAAKDASSGNVNGSDVPSTEADVITRPEPGLLIRCFASGLRDPNVLVQRGFLDLLVTHIPLNSKLLQTTINSSDLDLLVAASINVVLRRDMSLNRRLWAWFLGPEAPSAEQETDVKTPNSEQGDSGFTKQAFYFQKFGAPALQRCLLADFSHTSSDASEMAKPFRISSALMDRWEIGGFLIPSILIPGLQAAYTFGQTHDRKSADEVVRSASLFFDGIESSLIWFQIIDQLSKALDALASDVSQTMRIIEFLSFVIARFNVREEDMLTKYIPQAALVTLHGVANVTPDCSTASEKAMISLLDFAQHLVSFIPGHAVTQSTHGKSHIERLDISDNCKAAVQNIKNASRNLEQAVPGTDTSTSLPHILSFLLHSASALFIRCLNESSLKLLAPKTVEMQVNLMGRLQDWSGIDLPTIYQAIMSSLQRMTVVWSVEKNDFALALSIANLWTTLLENKDILAADTISIRTQIKIDMLIYFWLHLETSSPRHHVEAVRMLWKIQKADKGDEDTMDLSVFVTGRLVNSQRDLDDFGRFMTLWEHTIHHQQTRSDRKPNMYARRTSSYNALLDVSPAEAERVLTRPLLILLDQLNGSPTDASAVIAAWLRNLPSLDRVLSILISSFESIIGLMRTRSKRIHSESRRARSERQSIQDLETLLDRIIALLSNSSPFTWVILGELRSNQDNSQDGTISGTQHLADMTIKTMSIIDSSGNESVKRRCLRLLQLLFTSESFDSLRSSQFEVTLLELLRDTLKHAQGSLQIDFLRVISSALQAKEQYEEPEELHSPRPNDGHLKVYPPRLQTKPQFTNAPPNTLFDCIKEAIKAPSSRPYLEYWMKFLSDVLPLYSHATFSAMIPLVECFCAQIQMTFESMKRMATTPMAAEKQMPTSPLLWLLQGLELVLANAHGSLQDTMAEPPLSARLSPSAQSFFGGAASAVPSTVGDPSKTAKSNSRLTVILCVHDAVEICFRMWNWATYGSDVSEIDFSSAASTAYNAQKVRSRTKKMLEHLFAAEGLESFEALAQIWIKTRDSEKTEGSADAVFSLLNAMAATRPKYATPTMLNALYSRTNLDALEPARRSTLTCDLTAHDVSAFLLKYVSTIEDDALDEIWSDCLIFLRDVLSNPMPHRLVLPSLLELTVLLAEKVENTNFGERQRMHRELADLFSRLLTATFTVRAGVGNVDHVVSSKPNARPEGDLLLSLISVTPKLQSVLETTDRISAAINNISTHVIAPALHAKSFPENVRPELLRLIVLAAAQSPDAKLWKREVGDAFSDSKLFDAAAPAMQNDWFPVLRKWSLTEKNVIPDTLSRIVAPSAAALMFGVGANSARLAADRTAQQNLRRTALLLLANEPDVLSTAVEVIDVKISELCTATAASAPSCATRADIFMVWRALFLSTSPVHIAGLWPTINATLEEALLSLCPGSEETETYSNLSLLQACKCLDLLATIQPDDFQLQEWVFLTNTIDAVYGSGESPTALVDDVSEILTVAAATAEGVEKTDAGAPYSQIELVHGRPVKKKPLLAKVPLDTADVKAMAREDFVRQTLLPFLSGLSMAAYEGTYQMGTVDWEACRSDLVADLMDEESMV